MDRFAAMILLLVLIVTLVLMLLAFFVMAPITCSCILTLAYSLYLFIAYEESGVHHAQEFENRFWTIFGMLLTTALFFANDSPVAKYTGRYCPSAGLLCVCVAGYGMHVWDRYVHRLSISSRQMKLRNKLKKSHSHNNSLVQLQNLGIPVEEQLAIIEVCLNDIDQLLIPSTINNFINHRFVLKKEREIITVFENCDARALNYLVGHVKLGLLFYKIKDHRNFNGKHRTELINLLAVERLQILTVLSRVIVLHSLQLLKLRANPRAEYWVRNILLNTHQDQLSELKTLTDAKGDYFCMNKLIFDDIRSESTRHDILKHLRKEAAVQQTHIQMGTGRKRSSNNTNTTNANATQTSSMMIQQQQHHHQQWRKVLSDVDDTLCSSGGMYPAGIDKKYPRKVVYPGVLAFYRELDIGTDGPEAWQDDHHVGNLVFLSARPHLYKDISEKANFAKFEKLRTIGDDGRKGLHTMPSLLSGDLSSGGQFVFGNDFDPLARKKFDNFRRYVSIYPEYQHVFVCDNGQGDVRAGEMMFDGFPYEFEALYVHLVQDITKTYGYAPDRWREKEFKPYFFRTYPEAALHAASRSPPLIRIQGLKRICHDAVRDFAQIKNWTNETMKALRRQEINQSIWRANHFLTSNNEEPEDLIVAERRWDDGQKVRTPYGIGIVRGFDPVFDIYDVELDWRPLDVQVDEYNEEVKNAVIRPKPPVKDNSKRHISTVHLETVVEMDNEQEVDVEEEDDKNDNDDPLLLQDDTTREETAVAAEAEEVSPAAVSTLEKGPPLKDSDNSKLSSSGGGGSGGGSDISRYSTKQEVGQSSAEEPSPRRRAPPPAATTPLTPPPSPPTEVPSLASPSSSVSSFEQESPPRSSSPRQQQPRSEVLAPKRTERDGTIHFPRVTARICGNYITKYSPPTLPKLDSSKPRSSIFTFLQAGEQPPKQQIFAEGEKVSTPYGPAKVVEHRSKQGVVVVSMIGWNARAYLKEAVVKPASKSLIRQLFRQLSSSEKPLEFPHAKDTEVATPFGKGRVSRPIPVNSSTLASQKLPTTPATIGISLEKWTMADGSHPTLYATVETAQAWKDRKVDESSIMSALGNLVESSRNLLSPFLPQKQRPLDEAEKLFSQYYVDAAAVTTPFGNGTVLGFRPTDGFYEVSLIGWTLADGSHPNAYLRKEDINHRVADGCQEGYPLLTSLGLSGTLASVVPTSGVHIVTIPSAGMVCYLQPDCVVRPLKAAVGEDVWTAYGPGTVAKYNLEEDEYSIVMSGWNAKLYCKGDAFDRVSDGIQDRDAAFGVNWLLRFLFFSTEQVPRSRSNSVVSAYSGSQSNRSVS